MKEDTKELKVFKINKFFDLLQAFAKDEDLSFEEMSELLSTALEGMEIELKINGRKKYEKIHVD